MENLIASEIACRQYERIEGLLWDNVQAYFELTGSPGVPPLSSLGQRCTSEVQGSVRSFAVDGVTILRVSCTGGDVRVLYSLLTGGDLEAKS